MNIHNIIDKIKDYESQANHKSALDISNLLENNKNILLGKIDADNFRHLSENFENLAQSNEYKTEEWKREYEKFYGLLLFYLDKII